MVAPLNAREAGWIGIDGMDGECDNCWLRVTQMARGY
jgi:hypothetical protein